ncbi:MAG TPA: hypothetical protein VF765_36565 [Polyangiaceae bacterium]
MRRVVLAVSCALVLAQAAACASSPAPCPAVASTPPAPPPVCPPPSVSTVPTAASAPSAAPAPAPAPTAPSQEPPAAFKAAMDSATKAIATGDYATADRQLDAAAAAAASAGADQAHLQFHVAHLRAARFAAAHDFERAAAALVAVVPELARHPESSDEFWAHNALMMIREAQGDPAAALAENDQAGLAAARGTWDTPQDRETLAYTKDRWHRAYLTRMLAEMRKGSERQALVDYAKAALEDYRTRAHAIGGYDDSIAILDAYFAALAGDGAAALRAAKLVDPTKDDDVEDLYLVVIGLRAGGDRAGAEAVERIMRAAPATYIARSIMVSWLDHDARWPADRTFTPRHPASP